MQLKFTIITLLLLTTIGLKGENLDTLGAPILVEIDTTLCPGKNFTDPSGSFSEAGIYIDTFALGACDSIRTLNLSYFESMIITTTICETDFIPGTFTGTIIDENGCEQPHQLILVPANSTVITNITLCPGSVYQNSSGTYSEPGMYIDTISTEVCDSISILNLSFYPESPEIVTEGCTSDFHDPTAPGTYTNFIIDQNGCDQIQILNVLLSTPDVVTDVDICPGDTVIWMNQFITEIGSYQEFQTDPNGCEYTETLRVFEKPVENCIVST